MSLKEVTLEHIGTKERKTLPVESFNQGVIIIRWGMAGSYEINIFNNTIRSCSVAARRKHPNAMNVWRVVDMENVRRIIWLHFHPKDDSYERHVQNMPHRTILGTSNDKQRRGT